MNRLLILFITAFLLSSCAGIPEIPDDMSPAEIIQRGQEAMDRNNYKIAAHYYQALQDRYRTYIDLVITAEYHIAFIHYKQGQFELAKDQLNAVLTYYEGPDQELLPQHYKRLSQIVIERIEEREKRKSFF